MSLGHLRSLVFTDPLIVLPTISFGTLSYLFTLFDRTGRLALEKLARMWGRALLRVSAGVQLRIEGIEKIDPKQKYVFVANHSSYMDIPAVLASLPVEIRFYAKQGPVSRSISRNASGSALPPASCARRCPGHP